MAELNRRDFVALTVAGTCACCAAAARAEGPTSKPAKPPTSQPAKPAPAGVLDAGSVDQFANDGIYDAFRQSHKVLLYRQANKVYASSARCTHKGCVLKTNGPSSLKCPCHGSEFDVNGIPTSGQAKVALFRYAIALKDGKIVVNTKKQFVEKDWQKSDAFVEIKPA